MLCFVEQFNQCDRVTQASIPEALVRSASLIIGPVAAQELKRSIEQNIFKVPHDSTISRSRLKMDASQTQIVGVCDS